MKQLLKTLNEKVSRNKILIQNFSYLSLIQMINLLIPLITFPYLLKILGKEIYGLVVFAQAIVSYFLILVNFGFNLSATKEISQHRYEYEKLNEIVSSVIIIKSVLFCVAIIILVFALLFIPEAQGYEKLFLFSILICLGDLLFPVWYFQGIEQMKYITIITLISRIIFLSLIFTLIKKSEDYLLVPVIYGISYLISGIIALQIVFLRHKIKFQLQSFDVLKRTVFDSAPIFFSNVSISLYVSTNKIICGTFLGMGEVAYYDLAEKITTVLKMPQAILSQTLFPKNSNDRNIQFIKYIFKLSLIGHLTLFSLLLLFSAPIVRILGGEDFFPAIVVVNILGSTVPIIAMSNIFGIQILIPHGHSKDFSRVLITAGFIYLILAFILWITFGFSIISISIITLLTEIFVTLYMFYFCKKHFLWN